MKTQFAIYRIKNPEIRRNSYECAAWYQSVKVPAGDYPVYLAVYPSVAVIPMQGTIVGSDFSSYFGGNRYGSKRNEDVGQAGSVCPQPYLYQVLESIQTNPDSPYQLLPGWEIQETMICFAGEALGRGYHSATHWYCSRDLVKS